MDLEKIADELLASAGALGRKSGIYTQAQIDRKMRLEKERLPVLDEFGVPGEVREYLFQRQVDELVEVSGLTACQEIAFRLHVSGLATRDIAAILGLTHQLVAAHLRGAKSKVAAAYKEGRYAGWYEVYLSEVNRPVYHARSHMKLVH